MPKAVEQEARAVLVADATARLRARVRVPITPEFIESVCAMVEEGNYPHTAAEALGITASRFKGWMDRGEQETAQGYVEPSDPTGLYAELFLRVSECMAQWEVDTVRRMNDRVNRNSGMWAAHMTMLERRDPSRWGRREGSAAKAGSFEETIRKLQREMERAEA